MKDVDFRISTKIRRGNINSTTRYKQREYQAELDKLTAKELGETAKSFNMAYYSLTGLIFMSILARYVYFDEAKYQNLMMFLAFVGVFTMMAVKAL